MLPLINFSKRIRLALGLVLAASCFLPVRAQHRAEPFYRQEISFGVGSLPFVSVVNNEFPRLENRKYGYDGDLYEVYRTRYTSVQYLPVLTLNYRRYLTERISLGMNLNATRVWGKGYNVVSGADASKKDITALYLMPQLRCDYIVRGPWRLFGHVDLGAGYWNGREDRERISKIEFAGELVPFGVNFGRRFFCGAEMVVGYVTYGFRGSIGYRF